MASAKTRAKIYISPYQCTLKPKILKATGLKWL